MEVLPIHVDTSLKKKSLMENRLWVIWKIVTTDWHCISEPKDLFALVRTEDIAASDSMFPVERLKLVATDGATNYKREYVDKIDDETFAKWMKFRFATCERLDLIGASHYTLDILQKN